MIIIRSPMADYETIIRAQKFFKRTLREEIRSIDTQFSLDLYHYDLNDSDIEELIAINGSTTLLSELSLRISNYIHNRNTLSIFFSRLNKNPQLTTLSFLIKYLDQFLFTIFLEFLGKLNPSVIELKIQIKCLEQNQESEYLKQMLTVWNSGNCPNWRRLAWINTRLDTAENYYLWSKFVYKLRLEDLTLSGRKIHNKEFGIDISRIKNVTLSNIWLNKVSSWSMKYLNISNNNLSWQGLKSIASLLVKESTTLEDWNLSSNLFGDPGCEILSTGIETNKSLLNWDWSKCNIMNNGAKFLAKALVVNNKIHSIDWRYNNIGDEGMTTFCETLRTSHSKKYKKVNFLCNCFSDIGYIKYSQFLREHCWIENLEISGTIKNSQTKREILANVERLVNVEVIDLHSFDVPENCFPEFGRWLMNNTDIKSLYLSNNKTITLDALNTLVPGLEKNNTIVKWSWSQCKLGDEEIDCLCNALVSNNVISWLHLDYNNIGRIGVKAICETVLPKPSLKKLLLGHNSIDSAAAFDLGSTLRKSLALEEWYINSNKIGDDGCEHLAHGWRANESIHDLNIENNFITNSGISLIAKAISDKQHYVKLNIASNEITEIEEDLYRLFNWIPVILISGNPLSAAAVTNLFHGTENNRLFKRLRLGDIGQSVNKYSFTSSNTNWKEFDLSYHSISNSLLEVIIPLKNISVLNLQTNSLGDDSVHLLCSWIKSTNSPVKTLFLQNNHIGFKGGKALSQMWKTNQHLRRLNLADNPITHWGMNLIFDSLVSNTSLQQLSTNWTGINDYSAENIYRMWASNTTMYYLSLKSNKLSSKGICKVFSSLKINRCLKFWSVGDNYLKCDDVKELGKCLRFNTTLLYVELNTGLWNDQAWHDFSSVFVYNHTLISCNLLNNNIGYEGFCKLVLCLQNNTSVHEVKILLNKPNKDEKIKLSSVCPKLIDNI